MKLLFDENLPPALVGSLQTLFPGSAHVHDCGLASAEDAAVWDYARIHGFTITTKDSDFEQLCVLRGSPPKVIWLRTGNCTTLHLTALLTRRAETVQAFDLSGTDAVLELR
jgi:predicted nuclease of predicted toxin-antitoxin system